MSKGIIKLILVSNILILSILTLFRIKFDSYHYLMDNLVQIYEIVIHIALICLAVNIYSHSAAPDKKSIQWLIFTNIAFFLNDSAFYFAIFLNSSLNHLVETECSNIQLFLNNIPFSIWLITTTIFLSRIIISYILTIKHFIKITTLLLAIDIIIITYYWMPVNFNNHVLGYSHREYLMLTSIIELIIFELCILCLIHSKSRSLSMVLAGIVIMISGDFITTYSRMAQIEQLFKYGDSIWCYGLLFILYGFIRINLQQEYSIKTWFNSYSNIKSKISTWSLSMSLISFMLFFIIASYFKILSQHAFVLLPLYLMFYSILVVIMSLEMGHVFETPFIKIEENINNFINEQKISTYDDFTIKEFIVLQHFLLNTIKMKEKQDLIRKRFSDIAAETVHDIVSPINALKVTLRNFKANKFSHEDIDMIARAIDQIQNTTGNLLTQYRRLNIHQLDNETNVINEDDNQEHYFILTNIIKQIIYDKSIEWNNHSRIISKFENKDSNSWIIASPTQISRCISNLLNNAYESSASNGKPIIVEFCERNNYFHITIQDFGTGIPDHEIKNVLSGKSLKHSGKGIGLSGAKKYVEAINGKLDITSQLGRGTTIEISLPIAQTPQWYKLNIEYTNQSTIVILDDDLTILMMWQNMLPASLACKYFSTPDEFIAWINSTANTENIILLIDYDLNADYSGLDIIARFPQIYSLLITSHAEESWLQKIATKNKFTLIPKSQISLLNFI